MNKRNLIIGIIILIALVGGVVLWQQKNSQQETKQQTNKEITKQTQEQKTTGKQETTKEQTNNQNKTIDGELKPEEKIDTSDWNTYRNKEYGFEFKYPKDWEVQKIPNKTHTFLLEITPVNYHKIEGAKFIVDVFNSKDSTVLELKKWFYNLIKSMNYKKYNINDIFDIKCIVSSLDRMCLLEKNKITILYSFNSNNSVNKQDKVSIENLSLLFNNIVLSTKTK